MKKVSLIYKIKPLVDTIIKKLLCLVYLSNKMGYKTLN